MKTRITQQGELVKISPQLPHTTHLRKRGLGARDITTRFTKRSRKNLLEHFAIINPHRARNATFITLTYIENFHDPKEAYRHIDLFLKKLVYNVEVGTFNRDTEGNKVPQKKKVWAVWRKEEQVRGAYHFHIMLWNVPFIYKEWVAYEWAEIINQYQTWDCSDGAKYDMPPITRIEYCKSRRKCWFYVSKYISKEGIEKTPEKGIAPSDKEKNWHDLKRVEYSTKIQTPAAYADWVSSGFNYGTNSEKNSSGICAEKKSSKKSSGRWWGWFNRKNIPLADKMEAEIELTWQEYQRFRMDLFWLLPHTKKIHPFDTVKAFWFEQELDPIIMLMQGIAGKRVYMGHRRPKRDYEDDIVRGIDY